jgi:uncharacterized protein (DUF427 family)
MKIETLSEKKGRESVWDYPRPPSVEDFQERIRVVFNGQLIADTVNAKMVLERGHPPVYYLPLQDVLPTAIEHSSKKTWCEWKGEAHYFNVRVGGQAVSNAAWFYPHPRRDYVGIANYVAFYAGKMEACYVGDERVEPQPGEFYGGWITSEIKGPFKGSLHTRE